MALALTVPPPPSTTALYHCPLVAIWAARALLFSTQSNSAADRSVRGGRGCRARDATERPRPNMRAQPLAGALPTAPPVTEVI